MPRYYHNGDMSLRPPTVKHPTLGPCITAPPCTWDLDPFTKTRAPKYVPLEHPSSICFYTAETGLHVIPPGGYVDIPPTISEDAVKGMAPHLLTEEEAIAAGLVAPPLVLVKAKR